MQNNYSSMRAKKKANNRLTRFLVLLLLGLSLTAVLLMGSYRAAYAVYNHYWKRPPDQVHLAWSDDPATTMTVVWRTFYDNTPSLVQFRVKGEEEWKFALGKPIDTESRGLIHEVKVEGLVPDTLYEYRVQRDRYSFYWSDPYTMRTAPVGDSAEFDVVYVADTGLIDRRDGLSTGTQKVVEEISKLNPRTLLMGGDYAYYNTDRRYGSLEDSIDAWFNQMMPAASHSPMMPTYGNHEALLKENYDVWEKRFPIPNAGFDQGRDYSFDIGPVHFVSIFAVYEQQGLTDSTLAWIESDISQAKDKGQQWIIPFMHVSAFADGYSHPSNLALRSQLGPLFEKLGVQVVLSSHDQSYERTYSLVDVPEQNRSTTDSKVCYGDQDGVIYLKSSPGGKESNKTGSFSTFQTPQPEWVAVRDDTHHVFTRLSFSGRDRIKVETFGITDNESAPVILDAFEYVKGACPGQGVA